MTEITVSMGMAVSHTNMPRFDGDVALDADSGTDDASEEEEEELVAAPALEPLGRYAEKEGSGGFDEEDEEELVVEDEA